VSGGLFQQPVQQPRDIGGADGVLDVAKRQRHRRIGVGHVAQTCRRRHLAAVEFQLAMRRRRERVQRRHRFRRKPGGRLRHQEQAVPLAAILDRDHRQDQKQIRDRAIGDPGFAAANDGAAAVGLGRRLQMLGMGARAGLGDRNRHADLAGRDPRQPGRTLGRIRKARNEEPGRHLPGGEGTRQPNSPVLAAIACSVAAMAE